MMLLDKPVVAAVFFQANTVKGFRFWDETGLLANEFASRFQTVSYGAPVPETLSCSAPIDPGDLLSELRINPHAIWLSYREGVSWPNVQRESTRLVDWIARAISVTQFSRLGLRVHLLWGGESLDRVTEVQRSRVLRTHEQGWDRLGNVTNGEFAVHIVADPLTVRIALNPIQNVRTQIETKVPGVAQLPAAPRQQLPDYAILLDADVVDSHTTESTDVKPYLARAVVFIEKKLVPFVAHLFNEEVAP